jgi:hypothetical protein
VAELGENSFPRDGAASIDESPPERYGCCDAELDWIGAEDEGYCILELILTLLA